MNSICHCKCKKLYQKLSGPANRSLGSFSDILDEFADKTFHIILSNAPSASLVNENTISIPKVTGCALSLITITGRKMMCRF